MPTPTPTVNHTPIDVPTRNSIKFYNRPNIFQLSQLSQLSQL